MAACSVRHAPLKSLVRWLPENHTTEKGDFLKPITYPQVIYFSVLYDIQILYGTPKETRTKIPKDLQKQRKRFLKSH